jgi:hypothetical protein
MPINNAYAQHINVLIHLYNVQDAWKKQFQLAVRLKPDIITSF